MFRYYTTKSERFVLETSDLLSLNKVSFLTVNKTACTVRSTRFHKPYAFSLKVKLKSSVRAITLISRRAGRRY